MPTPLGHNIFKHIFLNESTIILIQISPNVVPKVLIDNMSALFQEMSWHQTGN